MDGSRRGGVLPVHITRGVVICASASCSQRGSGATREEEGDEEKEKEEEERGMKAGSGE